ncbi:unnamed protein product, partial [Staurois parvus]
MEDWHWRTLSGGQWRDRQRGMEDTEWRSVRDWQRGVEDTEWRPVEGLAERDGRYRTVSKVERLDLRVKELMGVE